MGSHLLPLVIFISILGYNTNVQGERRCLDVIQWKGNVEDVSVLRETLQGGLLASVPDAPCAGVVIEVVFADGIWKFTLHRGPEKSSHQGPDLAIASTWIESQLAPPVSIVIKPREEVKKPVAAPKTTPVVIPAAAAGLPLLAAFFSGGAFSESYAGVGIDAEADLRLGPIWWTGLRVGGVIMPEQSGIRRDRLALTALAGARFHVRRLNLLPGVGVGLSSLDMTDARNGEENDPLRTSRLDLLGTLFVRAEVELSSRLRLLLDLAVQRDLYNLEMTNTGEPIGDTKSDNLETVAYKAKFNEQGFVPRDNLVFLLRLGLAWRWSGW